MQARQKGGRSIWGDVSCSHGKHGRFRTAPQSMEISSLHRYLSNALVCSLYCATEYVNAVLCIRQLVFIRKQESKMYVVIYD